MMRSQKTLSFAGRSAGGFPAMIAQLIAPIEIPVTQSGWRPASASASTTTTHTIMPEHIMASGALPRGFPAIEIEGEPYWLSRLICGAHVASFATWWK